MEKPEWGHSAFTKNLISGLETVLNSNKGNSINKNYSFALNPYAYVNEGGVQLIFRW